MEILRDTETELVLGWGIWWKVLFKFFGISIVGSAVAIIATGYEPVISTLICSPAFVFALWAWKLFDGRISFKFYESRNLAKVRYVKNQFLGGWKFFYKEEEIPLTNLTRIYYGENYGVEVATYSAETFHSYNLRVPMNGGRSLRVYYGRDPETARYLKGRLHEHAVS